MWSWDGKKRTSEARLAAVLAVALTERLEWLQREGDWVACFFWSSLLLSVETLGFSQRGAEGCSVTVNPKCALLCVWDSCGIAPQRLTAPTAHDGGRHDRG